MTIRVIYSGGDGTVGTASSMTPTSGEWATAYQTTAAALAASSATDVLLWAHDHSYLPAGANLLTFPSTPGLVGYCIDRTTHALVLTGGAQEGVGAAAQPVSLAGFADIYGLDILGATTASVSSDIAIGVSAIPTGLRLYGGALTLRTTSAAAIALGVPVSTTADDVSVELHDVTLQFSATTQRIELRQGRIVLDSSCSIDSAGSAPATLFKFTAANAAIVDVSDCDLSGEAWTNLCESDSTAGPSRMHLSGCKMPSGWSPGTISTVGPGGPEVSWVDCENGDTHGLSGRLTNAGTVVSDTGVYFTAGLAGQSYKVTTSSVCTPTVPIYTPWVDQYVPAGSAIAPYVEILRNNDSTSALTDAQVWIEARLKTTSGVTQTTLVSDRVATLGSAANQEAGAGTSSWTGESGSCWSGKLTAPSLTPAEGGWLSVRVGVAMETAGKINVDMQIRT